MTDFQAAVAAVIAGLQPGQVVTYGEVAAEAGFPGAARAVGTFLRDYEGYAWWRVVRADGRLLAAHEVDQTRRLLAEGVAVADGRIRPSAVRRPLARGLRARRGRAR